MTDTAKGAARPRAEDVISILRGKLTMAFKEINEVRHRVGELSKDVRVLRDMFSREDNWGALAKRFIESGEMVQIHTVNGEVFAGKIVWVDRYNIGVQRPSIIEDGLMIEGMYLKGGIVSIFPLTHH